MPGRVTGKVALVTGAARGQGRLGQRFPPQQLLDTMLRIPAKGLTNIAFPLQVASRELARVSARDARVLLLSDCAHGGSPALAKLGADLKGKIVGGLDVVYLQPVSAGDPAKGAL